MLLVAHRASATLRDTRDGRQADKVAAQCEACATLLAEYLYVWSKPFPEKATIKSWSKENQSFTGMNIEDFANSIMANFTLKSTSAISP
jgi:hypothetical protein